MKRPGRQAGKLAALAVGTLVALALAEGLARLAETRAAAAVRAAEAAAGDEARPRTRRYPQLGAERGDVRILVVGDSFTVGGAFPVQETYPGRLAELLGARFGPDAFEVLTLASSGWNTEEEVYQARPYVVQLSPDLILLGVCLNDPEPSEPAVLRQHFLDVGLRDPRRAEEPWLYRASAAVRLGVDAYRSWRSKPAVRRYYRSFYDEELPSWQAFERALDRFRRLARKRRAGLVLVVFPIFDSPLDDRYPYRDLHEKIVAAARETGIRTLDLLPFYEGIGFRDLQVSPTDPHPSALAHQIAAERIVEYLETEGLLARPEAAGSRASRRRIR